MGVTWDPKLSGLSGDTRAGGSPLPRSGDTWLRAACLVAGHQCAPRGSSLQQHRDTNKVKCAAFPVPLAVLSCDGNHTYHQAPRLTFSFVSQHDSWLSAAQAGDAGMPGGLGKGPLPGLTCSGHLGALLPEPRRPSPSSQVLRHVHALLAWRETRESCERNGTDSATQGRVPELGDGRKASSRDPSALVFLPRVLGRTLDHPRRRASVGAGPPVPSGSTWLHSKQVLTRPAPELRRPESLGPPHSGRAGLSHLPGAAPWAPT